MARYGQSKLANILHASELNRRLRSSSDAGTAATEDPSLRGEIWTAAVHPGHIQTGLNNTPKEVFPGIVVPPSIMRSLTSVMRCLGILASQEHGAWSTLYAIASPEFGAKSSGGYIVPYAQLGIPSSAARDEKLAARLWEWTEKEMKAKDLLRDIWWLDG